jgi:hypothetical protein
MILITLMLTIAAAYTGGSWLWMAYQAYAGRASLRNDESLRREVQDFTYHLGVCFILAVGFLGLLVK